MWRDSFVGKGGRFWHVDVDGRNRFFKSWSDCQRFPVWSGEDAGPIEDECVLSADLVGVDSVCTVSSGEPRDQVDASL